MAYDGGKPVKVEGIFDESGTNLVSSGALTVSGTVVPNGTVAISAGTITKVDALTTGTIAAVTAVGDAGTLAAGTLTECTTVGTINTGTLASVTNVGTVAAITYVTGVGNVSDCAIGQASFNTYYAPVDFNAAAGTIISAPGAGTATYITNMLLTASAETDIVLLAGTTSMSGTMAMMASGETTSVQLNFAPYPLCIGTNLDFIINNSAGTDATISGMVTYYVA